jgi:hypothetical protein
MKNDDVTPVPVSGWVCSGGVGLEIILTQAQVET